MKLGEALQERAAAQRRVSDLRERVAASVLANEDEQPPEDPTALLAEAEAVADQLGTLIRRINLTNARTTLADGNTVTEALARRDVLSTKLATLEHAAKATRGQQHAFRFGRSELRSVVQVDMPALRARIDELATQRRELDATLQRISWEVDLIE